MASGGDSRPGHRGRVSACAVLLRLRGPVWRVGWDSRGVCALSEPMRRQERIPPDVALAQLAGRQWGVVSLAQLCALGIGARAAQRRAQAGRLRRVHRGVYAVGGAVLPREGRWLVAVMACGPAAVLSHVSAAVHWNLLNYEPARPEVTAPASAKASRGSACTAHIPSMPRTPPTTKASQPRPCTARCSTSRRTSQPTTASDARDHGLPQPRATTPLTSPTTPVWRPTSTSPPTASSATTPTPSPTASRRS